jgi:hypothetical protein
MKAAMRAAALRLVFPIIPVVVASGALPLFMTLLGHRFLQPTGSAPASSADS